jgi:cytochrome c oxidase subunit II
MSAPADGVVRGRFRRVKRFPHAVPLAILFAVIVGISTAIALLIDWLPTAAAEQADRTDTLMWFLIWCSIIIFSGVTTVMVYALWKFRAPPGDQSDGPPLHGSTRLEVIWTVLPTILLAVVAVWAYLVLTENEALADDRLEINVAAEQFAWSYTYPQQQVESGDLRVPVDRQIRLRMRSQDIIHSWFVNEFRVKQDVVPGITTYITFNPTRTGTFQVICAELCGVGHGVMRSRIIVMEPGEYDQWLADAQREVQQAEPPADEAIPPGEPPEVQQPEDAVAPPGEGGDAGPGQDAPASADDDNP